MKNPLRLLVFILLCSISAISKAQGLTIDSVMQKVSKGKPYILVLLVDGKPLPSDQALVTKMQSEHLVRLFQMEKDGKISIFGPVTTDKAKIRGIIIFNSPDAEAAKKELDADPYVKEGYMKYELYNWFSIPGQRIP